MDKVIKTAIEKSNQAEALLRLFKEMSQEGQVSVLEQARRQAALEAVEVVEEEEEEEGEEGEDFLLSKRDKRQMEIHQRREQWRLHNYSTTLVAKVATMIKDPTKYHFRVMQETGLRGLLWHMAEAGMLGGDEVKPAIMHIQNEVEVDGRKQPIPEELIDALIAGNGVNQVKWLTLKEKHLINTKLIGIIAKTFPKAVDFRAYVSGLCAPGKFVPNVRVHFRDPMTWKMDVDKKWHLVYTLDENGERIPMPQGNDGNAIIHPDHPILKMMLMSAQGGTLQHRFWEPMEKIFGKGIFEVNEDAIIDGVPAIIGNKSLIKGAMKGKELPDYIDVPMTIIQVWDKPSQKDVSRAGFAFLQNFSLNAKTKAGVRAMIVDWYNLFAARGGMRYYVDKSARDDETLAKIVALCDKIGLDPMHCKDVKTIATMHMEKDIYTLAQGAGLKMSTYTTIIDNGIPRTAKDKHGNVYPVIAMNSETIKKRLKVKVTAENWEEFIIQHKLNGRVTTRDQSYWMKRIQTLNPKWDGILANADELIIEKFVDMFLPGDVIIGGRHPMVAQQNVLPAIVVKPLTGVLKATGRISCGTYRMNLWNVTYLQNADADGDRSMWCANPEILKYFTPESKVPNVHGGNEIALAIEPDKRSSELDEKAKIMVVSPNGGLNKKAYRLIAREGGGPTGELTNLHAMFMQLSDGALTEWNNEYFRRLALGNSPMTQESIDAMKRWVQYTSMEFASNPNNWTESEPNLWELPKGKEERFLGPEWYVGSGFNQQLNIQMIMDWAYEKVEAVYPHLQRVRNKKGERAYGIKKLTGWRVAAGDNKRINPLKWDHRESLVPAESLVAYCAKTAKELWDEMGVAEHMESEELDLLELIKKATPDSYCWEPVSKSKKDALLKKSGLLNYSDALNRLRKMEHEQKRERREIARAKIAAKLSEMEVQEIVSLIATQVADGEEGERDRTTNYIFRAVCLPGSPMSDVLGLSEATKCKFASEILPNGRSRAEAIIDWLIREQKPRQEEGEPVLLFQLALEATGRIDADPKHIKRWAKIGLHLDTDPEHPSKHMQHSGIPFAKCKHCCREIDSVVRARLRDKKTLANADKVFARVSLVNRLIKDLRVE